MTPPPLLPGLTIVLPCLDEEDSLAPVLREARSAGRRVAAECEIIVVDDGSQDATAVIAAAESDVRCIRHSTNRGRGAAVRTGLDAARMPYALLADGDGQFRLDQIPRMVDRLADADIVVGWRRASIARRLADRPWRRALHRLAPLPIHDPDCTLKLLRLSVLDGIELHSDGRAFDAELLIKCLRTGARVTEVRVEERPRLTGGRPHRRRTPSTRPRRELDDLRRSISARSNAS